MDNPNTLAKLGKLDTGRRQTNKEKSKRNTTKIIAMIIINACVASGLFTNYP
jgi:hypothetical protein